jgi:hypothetical protein
MGLNPQSLMALSASGFFMKVCQTKVKDCTTTALNATNKGFGFPL